MEHKSSSHVLDDTDNSIYRPMPIQEVMDDEETASFQLEDSFLLCLNKKVKKNNDNVSNSIESHATNKGARKIKKG